MKKEHLVHLVAPVFCSFLLVVILVSHHDDYAGMAPGSGFLTGTVTYHNAFWISCILGLSFSLGSPNTNVDGKHIAY